MLSVTGLHALSSIKITGDYWRILENTGDYQRILEITGIPTKIVLLEFVYSGLNMVWVESWQLG